MPTATALPRHIAVGDQTFALDALQSIRVEAALEIVAQAPAATMRQVRTAALYLV